MLFRSAITIGVGIRNSATALASSDLVGVERATVEALVVSGQRHSQSPERGPRRSRCVHMYEISAGLAGAIADQQPIVFPVDAPSQTPSTGDSAVGTAHLRSEILQLQLDEGWAGVVRPALVPAVKAFASSDTFASFSTGDARANVELCVKAIKQRQFEKAAACSRSLLASLPTVGS